MYADTTGYNYYRILAQRKDSTAHIGLFLESYSGAGPFAAVDTNELDMPIPPTGETAAGYKSDWFSLPTSAQGDGIMYRLFANDYVVGNTVELVYLAVEFKV
jgi:hypothetical protein